jgi:hypothetical protein
MRARDKRAIAFCVTSTIVLLAMTQAAFDNWIAATALAGAYAIWLLTRPRMIRVMRRMRGETVEKSSYYEN